jgi:hypothetical protein
MFGVGLVTAFLTIAAMPAIGQSCSGSTFSGAWFKIQVPEGFQPVSLVPSASADGYDAAEFFSPDGQVSFYIFAPQWSGPEDEIALNEETETLTSERTGTDTTGAQHRWWTITAKNGSYMRSYHETIEGTARQVIGLRYLSDRALSQYRSDYACFKGSLERFLD